MTALSLKPRSGPELRASTRRPPSGWSSPMAPGLDLNDAVRILGRLPGSLEERFAGARDTNRFLDKRIANFGGRLLTAPPRGQEESP